MSADSRSALSANRIRHTDVPFVSIFDSSAHRSDVRRLYYRAILVDRTWCGTGGHVINGAHIIIYSTDAEVDRTFLRDVLGLAHVNVGHGWLIFALPSAEVAVHPGQQAAHELYLMCADVNALIIKL